VVSIQLDATSFPLRSKENAHDYRYFPEPDLPPVLVTQQTIDDIKKSMPSFAKRIAREIDSYVSFINI
jgi:aspartyl-tRNA(Asn)/glutamyl-tRNA(Gln) amidotransferase subunit B